MRRFVFTVLVLGIALPVGAQDGGPVAPEPDVKSVCPKTAAKGSACAASPSDPAAPEPAAAATTPHGGLSKEEIAEGFVPLFDGRSLDGWQGAIGGYVPENGVLVCKKEGGGKLFTVKQYRDFILRFEFKLSPGGNNGVAIRAPLDGRTSRTGMEIQILDDTAPRYAHLKPYQYHGSIYGLVPAQRGHLRPVGQWNCEEILCQGSHIRVTLNGVVIVDADLNQIDKPLDGYDHPGRFRRKGYIGFLGHGTRVEFRNIRIRELP